MEQVYAKRKPNRLGYYDYSSPGIYFLTFCTQHRINYLWKNVGARIARPQDVVLTDCGEVVAVAIGRISHIYPAVSVNGFAIMPNHVHLLLQIREDPNGRAMRAPTTGKIVGQLKGYVTKHIGKSIWQKLYHDHIVRNEEEYQLIVRYIAENPLRWREDCFCGEESSSIIPF